MNSLYAVPHQRETRIIPNDTGKKGQLVTRRLSSRWNSSTTPAVETAARPSIPMKASDTANPHAEMWVSISVCIYGAVLSVLPLKASELV